MRSKKQGARSEKREEGARRGSRKKDAGKERSELSQLPKKSGDVTWLHNETLRLKVKRLPA